MLLTAMSASKRLPLLQICPHVFVFHSPSVLDRLNALVEPGGVLSIDERGVVGEEGVMTVAPHPNFRFAES